MKIPDYLLDEIKRLNRMNDLLEKKINQNEYTDLALYEVINKKSIKKRGGENGT